MNFLQRNPQGEIRTYIPIPKTVAVEYAQANIIISKVSPGGNDMQAISYLLIPILFEEEY